MTRRIVAAFGRALSARPATSTQDDPHFHQGAQGHPAACYHPACSSPRLEL
jgi:hypothetical protein